VSALCEAFEITAECEARWEREHPDAVRALRSRIVKAPPPWFREAWLARITASSVPLPRDGRGHPRISEATFVSVSLQVALKANKIGVAWPSQRWLGHKTRRHPRAVRDAFYAGIARDRFWVLHRNGDKDRPYTWSARSSLLVLRDLGEEAADEAADGPQLGPAGASAPPAPPAVASAAPPLVAQPRPGLVKARVTRAERRQARAWITPSDSREERSILDELQAHAALAAAGLATRPHAAELAAYAATLRQPLDLVTKGLRELAADVQRGAELPTLDRAMVYVKNAKPPWTGAAFPPAPEPPRDPRKDVARQERAAKEEQERLAREPWAPRSPVDPSALAAFEALLPRSARAPPDD